MGEILHWLGIAGLIWIGLSFALGFFRGRPGHRCKFGKWQDVGEPDEIGVTQIRRCSECNKAQTRNS